MSHWWRWPVRKAPSSSRNGPTSGSLLALVFAGTALLASLLIVKRCLQSLNSKGSSLVRTPEEQPFDAIWLDTTHSASLIRSVDWSIQSSINRSEATRLSVRVSEMPKISKEQIPCFLCSRMFERERTLQKHLEGFHHIYFKHGHRQCCYYCDEEFVFVHSLYRHIYNKHQPNRGQ